MNKNICPVCAVGELRRVVSTEKVEYGDAQIVVDGLLHSVCDACGAEVTGQEESRINKRLIIEARKRHDQLMSGAEIKWFRTRYGITQKQAAKIFGGGEVAFSKYEGGDLMQSLPMDRLLKVASAVPEAMEWLANNSGVELKRKPVKVGDRREYKSDFASGYRGVSKKIVALQSILPTSITNIYKQNDKSYEPKSNIA